MSNHKHSVEVLHHFQCCKCKKWWSIGDAPERLYWRCPWCGAKGREVATVPCSLHEIGQEFAVMEAEVERLREQVAVCRQELEKIRDCDWVITPSGRMDGVRQLAKGALAKIDEAEKCL